MLAPFNVNNEIKQVGTEFVEILSIHRMRECK